VNSQAASPASPASPTRRVEQVQYSEDLIPEVAAMAEVEGNEGVEEREYDGLFPDVEEVTWRA